MPGVPQSQREAGLLARFLAHRFAGARIINQVRLGPIPVIPGVSDIPGLPWNALANFRRWADAVVIEKDLVTIVEAKTIMDPGLPSTLQLYGALWKRTPEYKDFLHLPVKLMAVVAFDDPVLSQIARGFGIEVVVFTPPDIAAELANKYFFRKRQTQAKATPAAVLDDFA
jgi:hypothetical protein